MTARLCTYGTSIRRGSRTVRFSRATIALVAPPAPALAAAERWFSIVVTALSRRVGLPRSQTLFGNAVALQTLFARCETEFRRHCHSQTEFGTEEITELSLQQILRRSVPPGDFKSRLQRRLVH